MNLLKKSFTLFSLLFLFMLGIISTPVHKADATVTVNVSASPMNVNYGSVSTITWSSSAGVTSCSLYRSDTGATVSGLAPSDSYNTGSLYTTTTFTVNCTVPAYCSGTYNVTDGYCQGNTVAGSSDGTTIPGPYEGQLCSSLTESLCGGGWITHGCSAWLVTTNTVSCNGLSQTNCGLHSSGTPHCTWNP